MTTRPPQARRIGDGWQRGARRVLIALDDFEDAGRLSRLFGAEDILPTLVFSCDQLVRESCEEAYGLVVLDGRFLCDHESRCLREVQEACSTPLIAVGNASDQPQDGVDLALGSQDDLGEIAARGTALIDMSRPVRLPEALRWGALELDVGRHQARWHGRTLPLTTLQFRIMEVLALAAGSVVTDEQLSRRVWSASSSFEDRDRLVAHIRRIRRLIEPDPSAPRFLVRVRGKGFRLVDTADDLPPTAASSDP